MDLITSQMIIYVGFVLGIGLMLNDKVMLFHFSFYWNKHPSLPAAGHEPAVEPGRHHLSRVKFPKTAVVQPPLSVWGLSREAYAMGSAPREPTWCRPFAWRL